jgi:hypothetical protein
MELTLPEGVGVVEPEPPTTTWSRPLPRTLLATVPERSLNGH